MNLNKSLLQLNLALIFLSTSGILGKLVRSSPELTIWFRCILASLVLFLFIKFSSKNIIIKNKTHIKYILLSGFLIAFHWVTYFYALKLSNIAISLLTLYTFPAITALLEPIILKTKFKLIHLLLSILIIIGIGFMIPSFNLKDAKLIAIAFGLISALAYALRNIWTRKILKFYDGTSMMFYQVLICSVLLSPFLFLHDNSNIISDTPSFLGLAIITTVLGHTMFVHALKQYTAVSVSLISGIIPIYGILWGVIFINDIPSVKTIIGGSFILLSFIIETYTHTK